MEPLARSLPVDPAGELLVSMGGRWSLAYYLECAGRGDELRWVRANPFDPAEGDADWVPADGGARDPLGGAPAAPLARLLAAAEDPAGPATIRVLVSTYLLREHPRARGFLRELAARRGPPELMRGVPEGQGFQVFVFRRGPSAELG